MPTVIRHETSYAAHRVAAYPVPGDALDAIQKGLRALADAGHPIPAETMAWVERCEAVKAQFPKPEQQPGATTVGESNG
ncbi:hypothetical protein [Methylobacterium sp. ID0610]|uniref:hypothetical protein n=1 Tax=Methylobacterium carpenticola TaxID=3344827 RepID=UPI0036D1D137